MKIRLKYVRAWTDRKTGITFAYLRRRGQKEIRLPGLPGSPEFMAGYHAAMKGDEVAAVVAKVRNDKHIIENAVARYIAEDLSKRLKDSSRKRQEATLRQFCAVDGVKGLPIKQMDQRYIQRVVRQANTEGAGYTWFITVREFTKWAKVEGLIDVDPCVGLKITRPESDGHATWSETQIAQFEARWPLGTRERLLFALLLCTGQRCSDVLKLGPHSIVDGVFPIKQQKTGAEVWVPVLAELTKAIAACNVVGIHSKTYLATKNGEPLDQRDLNKWFREACDAAGLPNTCVPHGLRKAFCRRLADAGRTPHEIAALSGHLTLKEVQRYTNAYDRRQAGKRAMAALEAGRDA